MKKEQTFAYNFVLCANWMRNYSTISFLGLWEQLHNPDFKPIEFDMAVPMRILTSPLSLLHGFLDYASAEELVVLINLEDTNADLIRQNIPQLDRLKILREKAYRQLELLRKNQASIESLKKNLITDVEKEQMASLRAKAKTGQLMLDE